MGNISIYQGDVDWVRMCMDYFDIIVCTCFYIHRKITPKFTVQPISTGISLTFNAYLLLDLQFAGPQIELLKFPFIERPRKLVEGRRQLNILYTKLICTI